MSQIARVFVVLNLLVAAGFMFAAATFLATNNDYKKKLDVRSTELEAERRRAQGRESELQGSIQRLEGERNAKQEHNARLENENAALKAQVTSLEGQKNEKDKQIGDLTRVNGEHAESVQNLSSNNARLVEANTTLDKGQRDAVAKMEKAITDLNDEQKKNVDATNKIADQEKDITAKAELISQKSLMIEYAKSKGIDFENVMIMPAVNGAVLNADTSARIVQANVGSTQGVARGFVLDIVRGSTYIGRFRVDTVYGETCAGLVEILVPNQQVMVGDRVTTTLN